MAIQTLSFISLILRPFVKQEIDPDGWAYLLNYSDPHRNFDGEIMAFGAMSGNDIERYITELTSFGYVGPEKDESSDMVLAELFGEPFEIPSWVEIVDVNFFDENLRFSNFPLHTMKTFEQFGHGRKKIQKSIN